MTSGGVAATTAASSSSIQGVTVKGNACCGSAAGSAGRVGLRQRRRGPGGRRGHVPRRSRRPRSRRRPQGNATAEEVAAAGARRVALSARPSGRRRGARPRPSTTCSACAPARPMTRRGPWCSAVTRCWSRTKRATGVSRSSRMARRCGRVSRPRSPSRGSNATRARSCRTCRTRRWDAASTAAGRMSARASPGGMSAPSACRARTG